MGDVDHPERLPFYDFVSSEVLWKLVLVILFAYWVKDFIGRVYYFCQHWLIEEYIAKSNLKYDLLIVKLENLHFKIDKLLERSGRHSEALEELKSRGNEFRSELDILKTRISSLQLSNMSAISTNSTSVPGGPPPPPPPPPPFSLVTPAVKIKLPSSVKTDMPKKKPDGPPQFSISQADITKMLQKLKKTSSTTRLLGSGNNQPRKTPPRRKLFGRTPGHSRRRSITGLSPGDRSRYRTPLSSISPPAPVQVDADITENDCDFQE